MEHPLWFNNWARRTFWCCVKSDVFHLNVWTRRTLCCVQSWLTLWLSILMFGHDAHSVACSPMSIWAQCTFCCTYTIKVDSGFVLRQDTHSVVCSHNRSLPNIWTWCTFMLHNVQFNMAKLQAFELLVCPLPELAMCSLNMAKLLAFEILVCPPPELDMCSLNQVFIDLVRRHHTYTTVG